MQRQPHFVTNGNPSLLDQRDRGNPPSLCRVAAQPRYHRSQQGSGVLVNSQSGESVHDDKCNIKTRMARNRC
jgi:hypothetical protein